METGDRAAGNGDEHEAPYRCSARMHVSEIAPDLRDHIFRFCEDTKSNTECHDNQADTKDRIDLTDDLVDRNKGCDKVVSQNDSGFFRNHPFFTSNEFISVIKYWYQIKAVYDNEE